MIRMQPSRSVCKRSAEVQIKNPKSTTDAKVIVNSDKENSPTQIHSMPNQRVLRKRKTRQVSLKEESSDDSEAEIMDVADGKNSMVKSRKGPGKGKKSAKKAKESDNVLNFIVAEDSSKTFLTSISPLQKSHGRGKKYTENYNLASVKEDYSTSESNDDMVDVFIEKKFNADQPGLIDNISNSELASVHESNITDKNHSESSNHLDVMQMLMAYESTKDKPSTTANESDSDDNWEQVETRQSSPVNKSAKSKHRKRKTTENSDTDFELNPSDKVKHSKGQLKGKSQKRKKGETNSGEEKRKPKKPKKDQLSEAEKEIRRFTNRCLKDRDSCLEQCSLVMGVAFMCNIMRYSRKPLFQSLLLSLLPEKLHVGIKGLDDVFISALLNWYRASFHLQIVNTKPVYNSCSFLLMELISSGKTQYEHIYAAGFCTLLQALGLEARFVGSLYVPSLEKVANNVKRSVESKVNPIFWVESKDNNKILAVDVVNNDIVADAFNENKYVKPHGYIVSITDDLVVLDSTPKYTAKWSEMHRKARMLNFAFWDSFIGDQPKHWSVLKEHNIIMKQIMIDRGFPKSLCGFKHNLVFALEKDILKTEAIHPKDAPVLGTFKCHSVYSRDNVKSLKQIIVIKKEGRALKDGEVPYKMVKQKIVYDRWPGDDRWKDLPLYGDWQTEWYKAPIAENGVVPRNEFGNVELFKPWMLPKGTEHINLTGVYALARRLNIDAARAVTGFDFPRCRAVPVMSGVVVCKEKAEILEIAWIEYNAIQTQKAEDKRVKRIYDNWKLLIKFLLIKNKITNKYEGMRDSSSVAPKGHIHKFPVKSRRKDKVTGEMVQKCSCGLVIPVGSFEEEL